MSNAIEVSETRVYEQDGWLRHYASDSWLRPATAEEVALCKASYDAGRDAGEIWVTL